MGYSDLRDRRREAGPRWTDLVDGFRATTVVAFVLTFPAVVASCRALVRAPTELWVALACWAAVMLLLRASGRPRPSRTSNFGGEKALLIAIRDLGGRITTVEAALETPLTVEEADRILMKLATDGHLGVESHDGTLYYVLPGGPPSGPLGRARGD